MGDKMETNELDENIASAQALAKTGSVAEAVETLLGLEKSSRLETDAPSTVKCAEAVLAVCFDAKDWKLLTEHIMILSKRRSQLKQAVTAVVTTSMGFLELDPAPFDKSVRIELIETLRTVSDGKLYLEIESARLTKQLSKIREEEGDMEKASEILQEIAPETMGTMDKKEKVNLILEQMRLALSQKDFVRVSIIANKITEKNLAGDKMEEPRIKYHRQMIQLHRHRNEYLPIARSYHALYTATSLQDDEEVNLMNLRRVILFCLLAKYDNEQSDFLARMRGEKKLALVPTFENLARLFKTDELIQLPLTPDAMEALSESSAVWEGAYTERLAEDFRKRVVQHNIRVIAKYYRRMGSARLAEMLNVTELEMEERVSEMVCDGSLYARIDRLDRKVQFKKPEVPADTLNVWATELSDLLTRVEDTCHQIRKENVVHGLAAKTA